MGYDGSLKYDTKVDTSGFKKGLKSIDDSAKSGVGTIKKTFAALGVAGAAGLGAAVKVGMDFEAQMSTVGAISGATAKDMQLLRDKAKQMGIDTAFSATEAGQAMEYMAMAGWKTDNMLNGIDGIMNLAAASGENLASVSDIVTDAMTAFGLSANESGRFADVLASASSNANTNVGLMGDTFKYVAPVAGAMGFSIEDTATAIGLMANAGIKGSQAGTALRSTFTRLAKPPKEAAEAMDALNLQVADATGNFKPLRTIMGEMREKFAKLTAEQKTQYAAMIGGQEAMSGLLSIVNASDDDFNKLAKAIDNSNGAAQRMAEVKLDNLKGSLTLLGSSFEGLGVAIYDKFKEPLKNAVDSGIEKINSFTGALSDGQFDGTIQSLVSSVSGLFSVVANGAETALPIAINGISGLSSALAAAEPILPAVTGGFLAYKGATVAASTATSLFSAAAGLLSNPVGIAAVAVGVLAGASLSLYSAVKKAKEEHYKMGQAVEDAANSYREAKDKSALTDEHIQQWRSLKDEIAKGEMPADKLADAEGKVREHEQWFIDNYGDYITAEEEKNGIRDETLDKIQRQAQALEDCKRLELENQIIDKADEITGLKDEIAALEKKNEALDQERVKRAELATSLEEYVTKWDEWTKGLSDEEVFANAAQKSKELLSQYPELLEAGYDSTMKIEQGFADMIRTKDDLDAKSKKAMADNKKSINDAEISIDQFNRAVKQVAADSLGQDIASASDSFNLLKKAMDESANAGKISKDTLDGLIKKFPELKDEADKPAVIGEKFEGLKGDIANAWKELQILGVNLDMLPEDVQTLFKLILDDSEVDFTKAEENGKKAAETANSASEEEAKNSDSAGMYMMQGVANGIDNNSYLAENAARRAMRWILTAMDNEAKIHSPSKETYADGMFLDMGLANGISDYSGLAVAAAKDSVSEILLEFASAADSKSIKNTLSKRLSKGFIEASKSAKEGFEKRFKVLDKSFSIGAVSEEEYYTKLAELRDNYFKKETEEWYEQTEKILEFEQKKKKNEIEEIKKANELAKEERERRIKITEELNDRQLDILKNSGQLTEATEFQFYSDRISRYKEYAEEIKNAVYLSEQEKADIIREYNSQIADDTVEMYNKLKNKADNTLDSLKNSKQDFVSRFSGSGSLTDKITIGGTDYTYYKTADLSQQTKQLEEYKSLLDEFKTYDDGSEGFENLLQSILALSPQEGINTFKAFFAEDNIHDFIAEQSKNASIAAEIWGSGMEKDIEKELRELKEEFEAAGYGGLPDSFFDCGVLSASQFGKGFKEQLNESISDVIQQISAELPSVTTDLAYTSGTLNSYSDNRVININANGMSNREAIEAYNQNEIYEKHTRGW